jgi:hypothetical protein
MSRAAPYLERVPEGWEVLMTHDELLDSESVPMLIASSYGISDDFKQWIVDGHLTNAIEPYQTLKDIPKEGVLAVVTIVVSASEQNAEFLSGPIGESDVFKSKPIDVAAEGLEDVWTGRPDGGASRMLLPRAIDGNRVSITLFFGSIHPSTQQMASAQEVTDLLRMPGMAQTTT